VSAAADGAAADLLPLADGALRARLATTVAQHTASGPLDGMLAALAELEAEPDALAPAGARGAGPAPSHPLAWLRILWRRLNEWSGDHRRPALVAGFAMVLVVVLLWPPGPPGPDLQTLYGDQPLEELLLAPEQLADRSRPAPERGLWLGFAAPGADPADSAPARMIRLGLAIGALQALALTEPDAPWGDLHGVRALLQQLAVPVALPGADAWVDAESRRAFLAALQAHALERGLIAELHYGLWLEQLYLYLARSLEEVGSPGTLPAQAQRILAGIDPAVLSEAERALLAQIGDMQATELAGIASDREIRALMARVRDILDRRSRG